MSSRGLKKSAPPEYRLVKLNGQLKTNSRLSTRFIIGGAVVPHNSSAGEFVAFTIRWCAFNGIENIEKGCHSKTCGLVCPSCHTSVLPRPSITSTYFSYMWRSTFSAPAAGTSTT
jgi:hypothetical protein